MNTKRIFLNSLPLLFLGGAMVYAAAPSGGYLPGATTDPDCAPWDTDCFVQVFSDTDDQTLSLSGNTLAISEGNNVLLDNISTLWGNITWIPADISDGDDDNQTLALSGSELSIEDGNMVDLSSLSGMDTDDQNLTLSGTNLSIEDGNTIDISSVDTNTWYGVEDNAVATDNTEDIYVMGNVGIGTTIPDSKLSVVGLPSGTDDTVTPGNLAGAVCITDLGNMYIDTDGTCGNLSTFANLSTFR